MDYCYSMYGVAVRSDTPFDFPGQDDSGGTHADVCFSRGEDDAFASVGRADAASDAWFVCRETEGRTAYLRWDGLYEFLVNPAGTSVSYRPLRGGDAAVLQHFLFGQLLSFALVRQHLEPLHAAVVDVGGCAVALLGDCTYGKSTLAASLLRSGCRLLSDDLLVPRQGDGCMWAQPGGGRIKLLPDSAAAMLGDSPGVPMIAGSDKRVFGLQSRMVQRSARPLKAFVVLPTPDERNASERVELRRIGATELFHELVKNTFITYVDDRQRLQQNFSSNMRLASAVPGYRLRYPPGIDRLASVGEAIRIQLGDHFQGDVQ